MLVAARGLSFTRHVVHTLQMQGVYRSFESQPHGHRDILPTYPRLAQAGGVHSTGMLPQGSARPPG
ncbi:protein of unknown function [Denitratisoma oestradiolicum]|uniref:Uncharacterized protein n=1 Tax=Denitratisoma oestradiolicum TaxID=311182 RepID=A0A6S6XXW1_9PROT|nr:protein of unknown function [Denitratisoma oestradiolicum]